MPDAQWKKHERRIAQLWSRWLTDGTTDAALMRQPLHYRMNEWYEGDITIPRWCPPAWTDRAAWFMRTFMLDGKRRKIFRLPKILTSPRHDVWNWWDKLAAYTAAAPTHKHRVLMVLAFPGRELVAITGDEEMSSWRQLCGTPLGTVMQVDRRLNTQSGEVRGRLHVLAVETLLSWISPEGLNAPARGQGDVAAKGHPWLPHKSSMAQPASVLETDRAEE